MKTKGSGPVGLVMIYYESRKRKKVSTGNRKRYFINLDSESLK
jgi:hypothetical protein